MTPPLRLYDNPTTYCNATAQCPGKPVATVETIANGARFGTSMCRTHVADYLDLLLVGNDRVYAIRPLRKPVDTRRGKR